MLFITNLKEFRGIIVLARSLTTAAARGARESKNRNRSRIEIKALLQTALNIKYDKILNQLSLDKRLANAPVQLVKENVEICRNEDIKTDLIMKYPFVLYDELFQEKLKMLRSLDVPLSWSVPWTKLSILKLSVFVSNSAGVKERIDSLCKLLEMTVPEVFHYSSDKLFLFTKDLENLKKINELLRSNNFSSDAIKGDLWVLKYSEEFLKNRLDQMHQSDMASWKTWMLRCPEEVLNKHVKRETDNRYILGEDSIVQYLSKTLECTEQTVKILIRKHPQLQNKSLLKLKSMIELLHKYGFDSMQICRVPKILLHSTRTTEIRIKRLLALGLKPLGLSLLTKSQRQFLQHVESLTKVQKQNEQ